LEGLSRWERSEVARDLRRLGLSYGEIRELIDVKKSTLATWCRDIALSESQKQAILERTGSRRGIPVDTQWRRREEVQRLQQEAGEEVARLVLQPGWVAGVVLYWAEGNKTQSNLGLANSDARII
jgi:transposase